ncbi:hypothetical protein SAMN05192558_101113 [Actinokineospora alba]|uniref:Uncharacterized protein n=1 Tax=Actinokineospora alba TaxID=504798 RepID=A0A1H0EV03_9PSEU|nr:hypothetical protein [Actinokineospora alba]TDP69234.1 hypothetical protein C8E96_4810 [Actinokineospora alba]SDI21309.1 hypothetical protein SAMN05421871_103756 [Actinokineospora alba]SDN86224.1 hypothetical protein SAMN05192558_101113 [Actinokineospora alba]
MARIRRPRQAGAPRAIAPAASAAMAGAADGIAAAVRERRAADHDELRESGWQLTRLTGGLADVVALLATELADHDRHRLLRGHDGGDPAPALATASRELTELRQALEAAERAAREYYTALSGLTVDVDLTG